MPVSPYHYLNETCALMVREFPTSILDVGVGHGKWGFLARDVLEGFVGTRYFKKDWQIRVEGIEIFGDYRNPVWDYAYDRIYVGDACDIVPRLDAYDLIVAMEVIEHLDKQVGARLARELVARAVRGVVLAFPDATSPDALHKDESFGNPHERHRSLWSPEDFREFQVEIVSPNHVFVRDPRKHRITAADLASAVTGGAVRRESPRACECAPIPWLVLTDEGATLQFDFTGHRIHVYFIKHAYCGTAEMRMDGRVVDRVGMSNAGSTIYGCWRSPSLPPGPHVFEIHALPDETTGRTEVWLDDLVVAT